MAQYKIPYKGVNDSLRHLRIQIIDSLPYTVKNLPALKSPEEIFNFCKARFEYKNDPQGVELFQSVGTLLKNGGQGDCDCATIFVIAMLLRSGFTNCGIVLAGRNKINPTHIYAYVITETDEKQYLDLTNKNFNKLRPYPFKQSIPFIISKTQLDMFLQLADGNQPTKQLRFKNLNNQQKNEGVFIPSKNVFIPIDRFDNLPIKKAKTMLLSEGYEVMQLSEYLSGRADRKAKKQQRVENKQIKVETKQAKKQAQVQKKQATAQKRSARAEAKIIKATARETKAQAKMERAQSGEPSQGMKIFNKAGEFVTEIMQAPRETETDEMQPEFLPEEETQQTEIETEFLPEEETELEEGFLQLNTKDLINVAIFAAGIFLEKSKKLS